MNEEAIITESRQEGIERFTVGAMVIHQNKILLVRRNSDDFLGGLYEVPGGKIGGGETIVEALTRELREETNLQLDIVTGFLPSFDYLSRRGLKTRQFNLTVTVKEPLDIKLTEHDYFVWKQLHEIEGVGISEELRKVLNEINLDEK